MPITSRLVDTDHIIDEAITTEKIAASAITAIKVAAGAITAIKIDVDKLSAISANIGDITAGVLTSVILQTLATAPRIKITQDGILYQKSLSVGKYGGFKYGDGTKYGSGLLGYIFNPNFPAISIIAETNLADYRLYNRSADPTSGTHKVGDIICVAGKLKICTTAGTPGTFTVVGTQIA